MSAQHLQEEGKSTLIPTASEAKEEQIKPLHYTAMKEKQVQNNKRRVKQAVLREVFCSLSQGGLTVA